LRRTKWVLFAVTSGVLAGAGCGGAVGGDGASANQPAANQPTEGWTLERQRLHDLALSSTLALGPEKICREKAQPPGRLAPQLRE
jgi:hypothetical protein